MCFAAAAVLLPAGALGLRSADAAREATRKVVPSQLPAAGAGKQQFTAIASPFDVLAYQRDVLEGAILFFDTLRQRANAMLEHEQAGLPPLLNFKYETLLDARQLDRPANYALLRITEVGDKCWDDCVDPAKPPVIILDPGRGAALGSAGSSATPRSASRCTSAIRSISWCFFPSPVQGRR